ncbi:MAG TPA: hypothetical protein VIY90_12145 [Steroidobacteraceae bacterium]
MSTDNVTPILAGTKPSAGSAGKAPRGSGGGPNMPRLPERFDEAIGEQQSRVWRLKSLIECVAADVGGSNTCEDLWAALDGLTSLIV